MLKTATLRRHLLSIVGVCLLACTCFVDTAASSPQCRSPQYGPRILIGAAATAALGLPSAFAPDGRANLAGEVSSLSLEADRGPGAGIGGSVRGVWGRHGYRIDWFDIMPGGASLVCDGTAPGYTNFSASYVFVLLRDEGRELRFSAGGGLGELPHPTISASLGMNVDQRLSDHFLLSGHLRYLPNVPTLRAESDRGADPAFRVEHDFRTRARIQWRATPGFQPHVSVVTGLQDARDTDVGTGDRSRLYVSGLVGFESRWDNDN